MASEMVVCGVSSSSFCAPRQVVEQFRIWLGRWLLSSPQGMQVAARKGQAIAWSATSSKRASA